MGTHWGFDEKTLGTKENEKKPPSHAATQKEKTWGTLNACQASHETSPKASHQLHAISLPKTIHHWCFLPGLMASAEFWGHILMTSTIQLTFMQTFCWGCWGGWFLECLNITCKKESWLVPNLDPSYSHAPTRELRSRISHGFFMAMMFKHLDHLAMG